MSASAVAPGRNDPCPCGSGKKYKKCCLLAEQSVSNELTPRILNRCSDEAARVLMEHAQRIHDQNTMARAWPDFWGNDAEQEWPRDNPWVPLFVPWMIYHWIPEEQEEPGRFPSEGTIAARFLDEASWKTDELTRRYIEAARQEPLTFWQVEAVEPGRGLLLRDMVTQRECFAHERTASGTLVAADITFGHVLGLEGVHIIAATGPYLLPPARFRKVVEGFLAPKMAHLRQGEGQASISPAQLLEYDLDFIDLYQSCVEELLHPSLPEMRNSDGDKLEWATSTYRFSPEDRGRLTGRLEAMRNIERSEAVGEQVEFAWISQRRNAPIEGARKARIEVQDDVLVTECNSRKRDRDLRKRLESRLGDLLSYEDTTHKSLDLAALMEEEGERPQEKESTDSGALDLESLPPEARQQLEGVLEAQHMRWADLQIPVLGGPTPRQAIRTPEGREEVERLISDHENAQSRHPHPQFRFDFNKLRRELGLPVG